MIVGQLHHFKMFCSSAIVRMLVVRSRFHEQVEDPRELAGKVFLLR